jgi:hypothetical protein
MQAIVLTVRFPNSILSPHQKLLVFSFDFCQHLLTTKETEFKPNEMSIKCFVDEHFIIVFEQLFLSDSTTAIALYVSVTKDRWDYILV